MVAFRCPQVLWKFQISYRFPAVKQGVNPGICSWKKHLIPEWTQCLKAFCWINSTKKWWAETTGWCRTKQFQTPSWKRYLRMHLLAERFIQSRVMIWFFWTRNSRPLSTNHFVSSYPYSPRQMHFILWRGHGVRNLSTWIIIHARRTHARKVFEPWRYVQHWWYLRLQVELSSPTEGIMEALIVSCVLLFSRMDTPQPQLRELIGIKKGSLELDYQMWFQIIDQKLSDYALMFHWSKDLTVIAVRRYWRYLDQ